MVAERARAEQRSVAQMADVLIQRALEQESPQNGQPAVADGQTGKARLVSGGAAEQHHPAVAPVRASNDPAPLDSSEAPQWVEPPPLSPELAAELDGQTTVDEMLKGCPNCAEDLDVPNVDEANELSKRIGLVPRG